MAKAKNGTAPVRAARANGGGKSNGKSNGKANGKAAGDLLSQSPQTVGERIDTAIALIQQAEELLDGLVELSDNDRQFSTGRFRENESNAIEAVLDTADAFPQAFGALAERDRGTDDSRFETQPTRDDLARRDHLARLVARLAPLSARASDSLLFLGSRVREVSTPAYAIARIAAEMNPKVRSKLASATSFYGAPAKKASKTRAKKAKQAEPA